MEEEFLKKIEELNLENIKIKGSKEYKTGKDLINLKEMLKSFKFNKLISKFIARKMIYKYNAHGELENDFKYDKSSISKEKPKVAVYTCITGKYDNLIQPFTKFANIEYIAFTDNLQQATNDWNIKDIPENIRKLKNNILINRYIKFHPHELFSDKYDYSIYIDGNIKVISDLTNMIYGINNKTGLAFHRHQFRDCIYNEIEVCRLIKKGNYAKLKEQIEQYKKEGFPSRYGLYECNVIACDLKNDNAKQLLNSWWDEFKNSQSLRDQIALPYVVWKNGYKFNDIGSLGNNVYKNPKIRIESHNV